MDDYRQYFTVKGNKLYFVNKPIAENVVDEAKNVLAGFTIPDMTPRSLYESLIFSIANQRVLVERPTTMLMLTHGASLEQLMDYKYVEQIRAKAGCPQKGRFRKALEYVKRYSGGIEGLAADYLANPLETRRKITDEKMWIAAKTASLWYICLGGKKLVCMDIHNYRQIRGLGIDISKHYFIGKLRGDGRTITDTPGSTGKYEKIEQNVLGRFKDCDVTKNGTGIDGALITGLFWMFGAIAERGGDAWQRMFFDEVLKLDLIAPWSQNRDEKAVQAYLKRHLHPKIPKKEKAEVPARTMRGFGIENTRRIKIKNPKPLVTFRNKP